MVISVSAVSEVYVLCTTSILPVLIPHPN